MKKDSQQAEKLKKRIKDILENINYKKIENRERYFKRKYGKRKKIDSY